jgi:hypothetical protein
MNLFFQVLDLQNTDDLCFIQTHFDPLHIDDQYYENLYYGHHSSCKRMRSSETKLSNEESPNVYLSDLDSCSNQQETSSTLFTQYSFGYDQICSRCICVSSILRNLSFISGNDIELIKCQSLIHLLARVLLLRHDKKNISSSDNDQTLHDYQSEVILKYNHFHHLSFHLE